MNSNDQRPAKALVLYIIWVSMVVSLGIYQFMLGGGYLTGKNAGPQGFGFPVPLVFGALLAATAVRWILIPRAEGPTGVLVLMIIGLAINESAEFFGIFIVPGRMPQTKMMIFYLSLVSALQFLPVYGSEVGETPGTGFADGED